MKTDQLLNSLLATKMGVCVTFKKMMIVIPTNTFQNFYRFLLNMILNISIKIMSDVWATGFWVKIIVECLKTCIVLSFWRGSCFTCCAMHMAKCMVISNTVIFCMQDFLSFSKCYFACKIFYHFSKCYFACWYHFTNSSTAILERRTISPEIVEFDG